MECPALLLFSEWKTFARGGVQFAAPSCRVWTPEATKQSYLTDAHKLHTDQSAKLIVFVLVIFGSLFLFPHPVFATLDSCDAGVSPSYMTPGSTGPVSISFTNTSSQTIKWIKISRPSGNFTITGNSIGGWSVSPTESDITLTGSMGSTGGATFGLTVTAGGSEQASADWSIQASDTDELGAISCGGSHGMSITNTPPETNPPSITNIVVSNISDSQAMVSWTTDTSSNSTIQYGLDSGYGTTKTDGTMTTSHSLTLSGLTANTTYHYDVQSTDGAGATGDAGDNAFVTAVQGSTTSNQTGSVTTTTVIVRPTPSPTPTPDLSPPSVTVITDISKPFAKAPTISGASSDVSGVAGLQYSLDDGRNWIPMDIVDTPGATHTTFSFTPVGLLDDSYLISVQATDGKGNTGVKNIGTLVIDRLPPLVGANIITVGPQVLAPAANGTIVTIAGLDQKITLSSVGGPTKITLSCLSNLGNVSDIDLMKNPDNHLWSGILNFDEPGIYTLKTKSTDGAGNYRERELNTVEVLPDGSVTDGKYPVTNGQLYVYYLDNTTKSFVLWDGASYGQENPQPLDVKGAYHLYLPSGIYYLRIFAPGYETLVTSIFTLAHAFPVTANLTMTHALALQLGSWRIPIPDFRETSVSVSVDLPSEAAVSAAPSAVGREFPYFTFPLDTAHVTQTSLLGKPTILTFLNTWSPQAAAQLSILNDLASQKEINVVAIVPQESASSVAIFRKRGAYAMSIVADPDGILVEPLHIVNIPTHIIVDRKGIIQDVLSGVFNKQELLDTIIK